MQPFSSYKANNRTLVFIGLFSVSVWLIISSHIYHNNRFVNSANWISGNVFRWRTSIDAYLKLEEYNHILLWENKYLRNKLYNQNLKNLKEADGSRDNLGMLPDSLIRFGFIDAFVIKNSYSKTRNYLTIDKGSLDGVYPDMGVVGPSGVVGIVTNVSPHFAGVLSILNIDARINAGIQGSDAFGTVVWKAEDFEKVQLNDIPRIVSVKVGDTVVTAGMSHLFPKNIPIGIVETIYLQESQNYYTIEVKLLEKMYDLGQVYVIKNVFKKEIDALESKIEKNEQ